MIRQYDAGNFGSRMVGVDQQQVYAAAVLSLGSEEQLSGNLLINFDIPSSNVRSLQVRTCSNVEECPFFGFSWLTALVCFSEELDHPFLAASERPRGHRQYVIEHADSSPDHGAVALERK